MPEKKAGKIFRSVLFVPADDPKKTQKAFGAGADAIALDLEDAVAPERKDEARQTVKELLERASSGPPVFVRVNSTASLYILKDLLTVAGLPFEGIMLPKVESGEEVRRVDWLLTLLEEEKGAAPGEMGIVPFVESALGVERAEEIARSSGRVRCLAFGGNDFTMDIGTGYSPEGSAMYYARCRLVTASRAAGITPPLDTVNPDFKDIPALAREAKRAKKLGFQGKLVIHPAQVPPVNEAFSPTPEEIAWAQKVMAAFARAQAIGSGVIQLEGSMVELPVVRRAQQIISLANAVSTQNQPPPGRSGKTTT